MTRARDGNELDAVNQVATHRGATWLGATHRVITWLGVTHRVATQLGATDRVATKREPFVCRGEREGVKVGSV